MKLTDLEMDALTELFNIGLHRAAASLSTLTHQRIVVDMPKLWVMPIDEITERLNDLVNGDLATVHQLFKGPMSGDAVLLLEYESAALLLSVMTHGDVATDGRLDQSAREVLAEVGNIILGACLSSFGDILHVGVTFSVPRIHVDSLDGMMRSIVIDNEDLRFALLAAAQFKLSEAEVGGYLIIALGVSSLLMMSKALGDA